MSVGIADSPPTAGAVAYWQLDNFSDVIWALYAVFDKGAGPEIVEDLYQNTQYVGDNEGLIYLPYGTLKGVDDFGYAVGWDPVFFVDGEVNGSLTAVCHTLTVDGASCSDVTTPATPEDYWNAYPEMESAITARITGETDIFGNISADWVGVGMMTIEDGDEDTNWPEVEFIEEDGEDDPRGYFYAMLPLYRLYYSVAAPASMESQALGAQYANSNDWDISDLKEGDDADTTFYNATVTVASFTVDMSDSEKIGMTSTDTGHFGALSTGDITIEDFNWAVTFSSVANEVEYTPIPKKIKNPEEIEFTGLEGTTSTEKTTVDATTAPGYSPADY